MSDNRTQAERNKETIDYYVNNSSLRLIDHKIIEAKKRLYDAKRINHSAHIIHYSWLVEMLETARPLRLAKEKDEVKT